MRLHLLLSELTLMDVLLSFQAAVASSAGTPCLLAASSVRWSFRIYRLRSTSTMTTSPEAGCHGYCPPATTPFQLLRDVGHFMDTGSLHIVFPVSGGGVNLIFNHHLFYQIFYKLNTSGSESGSRSWSGSHSWIRDSRVCLFFPSRGKLEDVEANKSAWTEPEHLNPDFLPTSLCSGIALADWWWHH